MASLSPDLIAEIGGFPVTNTIIATVIVDVILIVLVIIISKKITLIPNKLQNATESLFSYFFDLAKNMAGKRAMAIFPWVMTFFVFILFSNFLGLLPGIGSIGIHEPAKEKVAQTETPKVEELESTSNASQEDPTIHTENETIHDEESGTIEEKHETEHLITLVRPATSDFNATLALATISLLATHILSIRFTGLKDYLSRFFVINPIMLFVGLLELVSEFIKIFSLSFRLFGNIYAGEVVLATITGLFAFLAPLPFLLLESIVAVVQSLVFAMLTLVFMSMFTEKHHGEKH